MTKPKRKCVLCDSLTADDCERFICTEDEAIINNVHEKQKFCPLDYKEGENEI